jgi:hypothetical protein
VGACIIASRHILEELSSNDVCRICDAITLFRSQLKASVYENSPKAKMANSVETHSESNGYQCVEEISDAKRIFKLSPGARKENARASIEYDACSQVKTCRNYSI